MLYKHYQSEGSKEDEKGETRSTQDEIEMLVQC
jgi:hypothetical protein